MTAVSDWDLVDPRNTDAELVYGSMACDRAAFAQIYDRYADRLHDFCVGMLRDRDSAADCVQDAATAATAGGTEFAVPDRPAARVRAAAGFGTDARGGFTHTRYAIRCGAAAREAADVVRSNSGGAPPHPAHARRRR